MRSGWKGVVLALSLCVALPGCAGLQSALYPRGVAAELIADLSWILFAGATAILLLVVGIMFYTLFTRPERRPKIKPGLFVLCGGVLFPVAVLSALLIYALPLGSAISREAPPDRLVVEITGHQWWWEIRYVGASPHLDYTTANELHLPVNRPVQLVLNSADVIHSFWVPNLAGKRDLIPGMTNTLTVMATETGFATGQCAEFCGAQHARMRIQVVMQSQADFERWLEDQRRPAQPPTEPVLVAGQAAFLGSGCGFCHTIRGTGAMGRLAPDLTHVASRRTIAAGVLANTQGNRQAWISNAQHFKPEARMPSFNEFDGPTLRAIALYLGSLQ